MIDIINFCIFLSSLVIVLMLLLAAFLGGNLKERVFRLFLYLIVLNLLVVCSEFSAWLMIGKPGRIAYQYIRMGEYFSYVLSGLQMVTIGSYLYEYLLLKEVVSRRLKIISRILGYAAVVLATFALPGGLFSRIDEGNHYQNGDFIWLFYLLMLLQIVITLSALYENRKILNRKEGVFLALFSLLIIVCYIAESICDELWMSHLGFTIGLYMVYINNQFELRVKMRAQEAELAQKRIAIMLSQIKPHFLYNILTSIHELCDGNPTAQEALRTFSGYLRANMDSLQEQRLISIKKELEHVQQYLWLEKMRYGARLQMVFDIQTAEFLLPPLTIQPIVENAVRYGVAKKAEGGTVTISTKELPDCYLITVIDDGVGFEPDKIVADGRSHIGIINVRSRLKEMCGGRLVLSSCPGEGTVVTIEIPKMGMSRE